LKLTKKKPGGKTEIIDYKWINGVPLSGNDDTQYTNYVEATVTTISNKKNIKKLKNNYWVMLQLLILIKTMLKILLMLVGVDKI
jgi:hypothetical protein